MVDSNTLNFDSAAQIIGAGIYSYEGLTTISASTISNNINDNSVGDGGGIGAIGGTLTMNAVTISQNKANRDGGGLFLSFAPLATIVNADVHNNGFTADAVTPRGGGIAVFNSPISITDGCIVGNTSVSFHAEGSGPINGAADANNNWWGASGGPDTPGADTTNGYTFVSSGAHKQAPPASCTQPSSPTPTPPPSGLAAYGVVATNFSSAQQDAILAGVSKAAQAIGIHKGNSDHPAAFKSFMLNVAAGQTRIEFILTAESGFGCVTNNNVPLPYQSIISCRAGTQMTEYTTVHELGHVAVGRTGGYITNTTTYFGRMTNPVPDPAIGSCPLVAPGPMWDLSCTGIVFGKNFKDGNLDWVRGERGWGSHSVPPPNPTNFQQNPFTVIDSTATQEDRNTEIDEASADMFLNWVYKKLGQGGFQDISWIERDGCNTPTGCPQNDAKPGTARNNWMDSTMTYLLNQYQ